MSFFQSLWELVKPVLKKLAAWFKKAVDMVMRIAKASQPYGLISLAVAGKFYQNVIDMTDELTRISAAAA